MKIKNIIIGGELKFIHIYYKNYEELDTLKIKFDGFVYKLYEYKRGNIMSLRMSNVNDECRNYHVHKIYKKESPAKRTAKLIGGFILSRLKSFVILAVQFLQM